MPDIAKLVELIAVLLIVVSVAQPLSLRLRLSPAVLLAATGTAVGILSAVVLVTGHPHHLVGVARQIAFLPVTSSAILFVFLPVLLFHSSMMMDVRRLVEDTVPILILAVVAVIVTTGTIGLALHGLFGEPLLVCLLLGSIVATTDPSAVVVIFRDLATPARLTRLVEGESLLNDAAAIAIFTMLIGVVKSGESLALGHGVLTFVVSFAGGILLGIVAARLMLALVSVLGDNRAAESTLFIALPYLIYVLADSKLHVSGVVAVVAAGLTAGTMGRARLAPGNRHFIEETLEQLAFWAGSLVFILASLFAPRFLLAITPRDLLMLAVLSVAAVASRALVMFGLLWPLGALGLSPKVTIPYKIVITWGGLRGAVTLALALTVTEDQAVPEAIHHFVAVLAIGFALVTLFINGTTLRALIGVLKLDRLSPRDAALRDQAVTLSLVQTRDAVAAALEHYDIGEAPGFEALAECDRRIAAARLPDENSHTLSERDRLVIALVALASHERRLVLDHHSDQAVSRPVVEFLLRHAEQMIDGARSEGRVGYARAAKRAVGYSLGFRIAHLLHRRFGLDAPLTARLARRFEALVLLKMMLEEEQRFARQRFVGLFGERLVEIVEEILQVRLARVRQLIDALRLQYPDYFDNLERRFVKLSGLRLEQAEYAAMFADGIIGRQLFDALTSQVSTRRAEAERPPELDLQLRPEQMIAGVEMFATLDEEQRVRLARLMRPRIVVPGEVIYRLGERGDGVCFVASGALEVRRPGNAITLGRGAIVGQMALLTGQRRSADVVALTYSQLLMLDADDFQAFLRANPDIDTRIRAITEEQIRANASMTDAENLALSML